MSVRSVDGIMHTRGLHIGNIIRTCSENGSKVALAKRRIPSFSTCGGALLWNQRTTLSIEEIIVNYYKDWRTEMVPEATKKNKKWSSFELHIKNYGEFPGIIWHSSSIGRVSTRPFRPFHGSGTAPASLRLLGKPLLALGKLLLIRPGKTYGYSTWKIINFDDSILSV